MKCLIPGINVKVLARAIHSLAKIGDEMYVEPHEEGLSFRTVNSSRSAYASFTFHKSFFLHYTDGVNGVSGDEEDEDVIKCKISMKSCIAIFKSPNSIDKHVETCQVNLQPGVKKLTFQFRCRHGVIKNHYLPIIECETLQAVYTKDMASNALISEPKLLVDALHNFQLNQDELTLAVTRNKITIRNFTDFVPEQQKKVIRTELSLECGEFVQYSVGIESSITFCLKELRALLNFAEAVSLPVAINFETAGRPVVFVVSHPHTFEANFVLATMINQGDSQQLITPNSSQVSKKRPSSLISSVGVNHDPKRARCNTEKASTGSHTPVLNNANEVGMYLIFMKTSEMEKDAQNKKQSYMDSLDNLDEVFEMEWENVNEELEKPREVNSVKKARKEKDELDKSGINRLGGELLETGSVDSGSRGLMDYSEQRESDISSLPSNHLSGVSLVYRRCFQETFNPANLPGYDEILAPDSDEEPD